MQLHKVSNRVFANFDGKTGGNVGIIILDDQVIAVDAQYPVSAREFRQSISSVTSQPLTHLLLTHYHGDHVFGAQVFEDCEIVAHQHVNEMITRNLRDVWSPDNRAALMTEVQQTRPERVWLYDGLRVVLPTRVFTQPFTLNGIQMRCLGGHTAGSSIIYVEDDRVLFAGDLVFAHRFPWAGDPSANPDHWIHAFEHILEMNVDHIIPGHGTICDKTEIRIQLTWFKAIRDTMKTLIVEGASIEEAVNYPDYPPFYSAEREEWRTNSLSHWYQFWSTAC
jgi:glyoxylase-like metal-dependent hydrolase (beta-lactamase superfamily II)